MPKCIICDDETEKGFLLQSHGWLCSGGCYAQFCKNREKKLAQSCWGEKATVEFGGVKYVT